MTICFIIKTVFNKSSLNFIGALSLIFLFSLLVSCAITTAETSSTMLHIPETHYILPVDINDASRYWNTAWAGQSSELYNELKAITITYLQINQYVFGKNDCNDMAVDLWEKLKDREIMSIIVIGNLKKSDETFLECNHAWLIVYSGEGSAAAIDLVCAKVYIWEDVRSNPQLRQYWEGFIYEKPSDLLADFKERW